ncbi:unnamed protein product [Protopolystoma xenopodis]|uniref:Uncharacterized protein n=1 Tax=Protopolystoma xenopodis TaxID=117903 RepID=A0A3S5APB6_9PLAT|nr:unnamed protein product [Protopolystoma xenopodis]
MSCNRHLRRRLGEPGVRTDIQKASSRADTFAKRQTNRHAHRHRRTKPPKAPNKLAIGRQGVGGRDAGCFALSTCPPDLRSTAWSSVISAPGV